jgi:hypothetical protein
MPDRPIIFSAPMVHALLEGRKTQTRRIIKPRKHASLFDGSWSDSYVLDPGNEEWRQREVPFAVGDRLWVRETWGVGISDHGDCPRYKATMDYQCGDKIKSPHEGPFQWRSPIHMPRKFSRMTLTVTEVRVQRVHEISEEDARAEGCAVTWSGDMNEGPSKWADETFADLWESIHGPGSWEANPWVAAISFTVEQRNIDAVK